MLSKSSLYDAKYFLARKAISFAAGYEPNKAFVSTLLANPFWLFDIINCLRKSRDYVKSAHVPQGLLRQKHIYVSGMPRTGGAYLTRTLLNNISPYGIDDAVMENESIPYFYLFRHENKDELNEEFVQVAHWVNQKYAKYNFLVKKNTAAGPNLDLLYDFYEGAIYKIVVTVRNPKDVYLSFVRSGLDFSMFAAFCRGLSNASDFTRDAFLDAYCRYYLSVIEFCPTELRSRILFCEFGMQNAIIKQLVAETTGREPHSLQEIRDRSACQVDSYWDSEIVTSRLAELKEKYRNFGFDVSFGSN